MVGSNISSGLGRFVLCESLESRQFFSAAIGLDPSFNGGQLVKTNFGGEGEAAWNAVVLKSGKLMVAGVSYDAGSPGVFDAFAVYHPNGTLDRFFDGDGKLLIESDPDDLNEGPVLRLVALNDGSVMVVKSRSLLKLLPSGRPDLSYGPDGNGRVYSDGRYASFDDSSVSAEGSVRVLTTVVDNRALVTYDAKGTKTSTRLGPVSGNQPFFAANGNVLIVNTNTSASITVSQYDAQFQPVKSYNYKGVAYLTSAYKSFLTANGPFTDYYGRDRQPSLNLGRPVTDSDGSLLFRGTVYGSSPRLTSYPDTDNDRFDGPLTPVFVRVSADGRTSTFSSGNGNTGSAASFASDLIPARKGSSTTLYTRAGDSIDVLIPRSPHAKTFVPDGRDGFYVLGGDYGTSGYDPAAGFLVGHITRPTANISGVLFNDANGNGRKDVGETVHAKRTVYLDLNENGRRDGTDVHVVTDAAGRYRFTDLGPGTFRVRSDPAAGTMVTTPSTAVVVKVGYQQAFDIGFRAGSATSTINDDVLT